MHDGHHDHGAAPGGDAKERILEAEKLLEYMLHHNEHHAEELSQIAARLAALGKDQAAAAITQAGEDFARGNQKLSAALAALKE